VLRDKKSTKKDRKAKYKSQETQWLWSKGLPVAYLWEPLSLGLSCDL